MHACNHFLSTVLLQKFYNYIFLATHLDSGRQYSASSNVTVFRPYLEEFDDSVFALFDTVITLRCIPNDTRAPILWRQ